jgi:hypothetical protein
VAKGTPQGGFVTHEKKWKSEIYGGGAQIVIHPQSGHGQGSGLSENIKYSSSISLSHVYPRTVDAFIYFSQLFY